jgi:membrane protein
MKLTPVWTLLKETAAKFVEDRAIRLSAATAYYAIFSIGPLLLLIVGLAGLVFGEEAVRQEVQRQVHSFVGEQPAQVVASMMGAQQHGGSLVATLVGGIALVLGAAGVFGQLQDSLNTIWGVTARPGAGIGAFLRDRFFSMAMVLGTGFLLLVSMVLSAFVGAFANYLANIVSLPAWTLPLLNDLAFLVVIVVLFALIFKVLPDAKVRWRDVWAGAVATALLFTIGKYLLGFYLAHEMSASAYGTGSAFVVVMLFVYYASAILYFGAELTQVYARRHGAEIRPSKYAVRITPEQRAQQGMPSRNQVNAAARAEDEGPPLAPRRPRPGTAGGPAG